MDSLIGFVSNTFILPGTGTYIKGQIKPSDNTYDKIHKLYL